MKHSVRFKMTLLLTLMVIVTIFILWFINRTFLSDYYVHTKIEALDQAFQEIVGIYEESTSTGYLSDEDTQRMERLELKYNVEVNVINSRIDVIYPAPYNFGERELDLLNSIVKEYLFRGSNPWVEKTQIPTKSESYFIYNLYDRQMESNYIDLIGFFNNPNDVSDYNDKGSLEEDDGNNENNSDGGSSNENSSNEGNSSEEYNNNGSSQDNRYRGNKLVSAQDDTMVLIRTNLESIEESAAIANKFLAYIGIVVVIIGSAAMYLISKKFTKPLLDLAEIAKSMSELNFEIKYSVKDKDEIGVLGDSINALSDRLEATITELKQANNELTKDIQEKTEIDEMRKEFLSNVSHELKTPISLIQGYAEGLKENINDDEESRDFYCEVIMDEASKMNQMVKKLLSLNELEFGNNTVNFERFDIVDLIRSVLDTTEILFKQKGVKLYFEQEEPIYVWADEFLIEQVVTNYISNALNHVSGQNIIEIKLIKGEETVRVAVFNTGENIPEQDLDKIWIKFYKIDKARTREYGGSGIGLSIVKAIMNSHNRSCGVINHPIGVEFWFELDTSL